MSMYVYIHGLILVGQTESYNEEESNRDCRGKMVMHVWVDLRLGVVLLEAERCVGNILGCLPNNCY